jgi:hypothetical protein
MLKTRSFVLITMPNPTHGFRIRTSISFFAATAKPNILALIGFLGFGLSFRPGARRDTIWACACWRGIITAELVTVKNRAPGISWICASRSEDACRAEPAVYHVGFDALFSPVILLQIFSRISRHSNIPRSRTTPSTRIKDLHSPMLQGQGIALHDL